MLVSGYALSVTLGSPLVALALSRMDRKRALIILMSMYVAGNLLCGLAPTYSLLLVARVLTALCHGAFFGIGSIVAADLVPKNERNMAISMMFSGLTIANVLGVPAGTAIGQVFGWRMAFFALVPIGLMAAVSLWRMVPSQPSEAIDLKHEFRAVMRPQVQLVLAMSTLSSVALFCVFTYIAPILESVTHLAPSTVTWVLVVFGVGITIGNLLGGKLADWHQMGVVTGGLALLVLIFALMPLTEKHFVPAVATVFVWGIIHFGAVTPLQTRVVEQAKGAPNLASTLNQGAFNLGNAVGAALGGLVLRVGYEYQSLAVASALVTCSALAMAIVAFRLERRELAGEIGSEQALEN